MARDRFLDPMNLRFDHVDGAIEEMESRLDQYHGETREVVATMLAALRDSAEATRDLAIASRELREEVTAAIRENSEQVRANTQAVLRLLGRFANGNGPAPAVG